VGLRVKQQHVAPHCAPGPAPHPTMQAPSPLRRRGALPLPPSRFLTPPPSSSSYPRAFLRRSLPTAQPSARGAAFLSPPLSPSPSSPVSKQVSNTHSAPHSMCAPLSQSQPPLPLCSFLSTPSLPSSLSLSLKPRVRRGETHARCPTQCEHPFSVSTPLPLPPSLPLPPFPPLTLSPPLSPLLHSLPLPQAPGQKR